MRDFKQIFQNDFFTLTKFENKTQNTERNQLMKWFVLISAFFAQQTRIISVQLNKIRRIECVRCISFLSRNSIRWFDCQSHVIIPLSFIRQSFKGFKSWFWNAFQSQIWVLFYFSSTSFLWLLPLQSGKS